MPEQGNNSGLGALCSLPSRRPWPLVLVTVVLAVFGGYVYFGELEIQSGRRQLSNLDSPLNQRVERYREEFGVEDSVVLVIAHGEPEQVLETDPPGPDARMGMKRVARDWAARLRERPDLFPEVVERVGLDGMGRHALLYLPAEQFDSVVGAVSATLPDLALWAEMPTLENLFALVVDRLGDLGPDVAGESDALLVGGLGLAETFFRWFRAEIGSDEAHGDLAQVLSASLGVGDFDADGYLFVAGGRALIVPAAVRGDPGEPNEYRQAIEFASRTIKEVVAGNGDKGSVRAGLSGLPALEYEEMVTSQGDFARSALIALVLVSALFMWAFRTLVPPLVAALCLCMAIGVTFVVTWILVGHLNLVSMVFAIILIVLGIDFAIHFATHYERALMGSDPGNAVCGTLRQLGGALWMGGLTTSAAFLSAGFTEAPGLSELGIIAGSGLVICLLVMFFVYPALLYLVDRRRDSRVPGRQAVRERPATPPGKPLRALCVASVGLAALGYAGGQYEFDTNLLALQPTGGEAARWQSVLLDADDRTQFAIATYDDRESTERARARFEGSSGLVRATESVFPSQETRKRQVLAELSDSLETVEFGATRAPSLVGVRRTLFGVRQSLRRLSLATPEAEQALERISSEVDLAYRALNELQADRAISRLTRVQDQFAEAVRSGWSELEALSSPPPFRVEEAPEVMRRRFVGRSGKLALLVYPKENTWDRAILERFVTAAHAIEPDMFGGVVNFRDNARAMIESFANASLYALVVVVALVLAWCRSLRQTVFALLPLMASVGLLLGIMRVSPWTLSWNFGNFFALPILIGIGVDSGIHLTRAWRGDAVTFQLARRAVFVSTLTTMIGFGILCSSQHAGVRSLGIVVTIGVALVAATSLVLLPVFLRWSRWNAGGCR